MSQTYHNTGGFNSTRAALGAVEDWTQLRPTSHEMAGRLIMFSRYKQLEDWKTPASDSHVWMQLTGELVSFGERSSFSTISNHGVFAHWQTLAACSALTLLLFCPVPSKSAVRLVVRNPPPPPPPPPKKKKTSSGQPTATRHVQDAWRVHTVMKGM